MAFISDKAIGGNYKYQWQCTNGHIWKATASKIINENQWCPICRYTTVALKLKGDIKEYRLFKKQRR